MMDKMDVILRYSHLDTRIEYVIVPKPEYTGEVGGEAGNSTMTATKDILGWSRMTNNTAMRAELESESPVTHFPMRGLK